MKAKSRTKLTRRSLITALCVSISLIFGCAMLSPGPSVCEDIEQPSVLCAMVEQVGGGKLKLEDIGNGLVIVNAIALAEGLYTKDEAITVLTDLRSILDNPVSYLFFQTALKKYVSAYPGLLQIANVYIDQFTITQTMYKTDRDLLISWLTTQIEGLEQ